MELEFDQEDVLNLNVLRAPRDVGGAQPWLDVEGGAYLEALKSLREKFTSEEISEKLRKMREAELGWRMP